MTMLSKLGLILLALNAVLFCASLVGIWRTQAKQDEIDAGIREIRSRYDRIEATQAAIIHQRQGIDGRLDRIEPYIYGGISIPPAAGPQ